MVLARLTQIGALLADRTRAQILIVLMDGRARTGGELARLGGVAPSTASEHLARLIDAGLITMEAQGRHRYFRLADADVAHMLESLGAAPLPERETAGAPGNAPPELTYARSCYDHLAGSLAVEIYDRLLADGHLRLSDGHLTVTASGDVLLAGVGVDVSRLDISRRPTARSCLDWTERRHHLAGTAGAALFGALLERRWLVRGQRPRSVRVTDAGQDGLRRIVGLPR